jgi:hypothetical protein
MEPIDIALTDAQIQAYRTDGFAVLRGVATAAEIAAFRPLIRAAWETHRLDRRPMEARDTYGRSFTQSIHLGIKEPAIRRFAHARRFARLAAQLMGVPAVRMFLDEAFFKEPGAGPTPWHQDQPVWPFDATQGLSLWIPLMPVTPEMGMLTFARGSHREGQILAADISDKSEEALRAHVVERDQELVTVHDLQVGDVTAHNGWTVHRADANQTGEMREVYALHFFVDGARIGDAKHPAQARLLKAFGRGLKPGDLADGPFWPLVYQDDE